MRASTLSIFLLPLLFFVNNLRVTAQDNDSTELANLSAELDALFASEKDSLSLLSLIDNLLSEEKSKSYLSLRMGYSSRVTSAGRSFGVDQQALIPGVSYYSNSGFFADVTGIWNNDISPKYFLTIATAGFMGNISKKLSYSLSYDHSFYHSNNDIYSFPLTNSINSSVTLDFKRVYTSVDYSYSFGKETASAITWNATGLIRKRAFKPFKNVTFFPSISILFGNQNITELYNSTEPIPKSVDFLLGKYPNLESILPNLTDDQIDAFARRNDLGRRAANILKVTRDELNSTTTTTTITQFGLMNYYLSLPVQFTTDKLGLTIGYNYNIPRALSNSDLSTESNGYFSFTLSYNLGF